MLSKRHGKMTGILFSKDRALQLDAALKSFSLHCLDAHLISLKVLYTASSKMFWRQYQGLARDYPSVSFIAQSDFRRDVLRILGIPTSAGQRLYMYLCNNRFMDDSYVLFLVDDNIFVRNFRISEAMAALESEKDALGFALQLGENLTFCYPLDVPLRFPAYLPVTEQVIKYRWPEAGIGLNYPLEVSSSLYRLSDIARLLTSLKFSNPNLLEGQMSARAQDCRVSHPYLLCYRQSVTFCNPLNKVQNVYANKAGNHPDYFPDALARKFDEGYRIDVEKYHGLIPTACHQEVELFFCNVVAKR
jgi:hypothetical protein